ncbi:MAG TPA: serine/threonine-protein kinase [Vicinamibacterales bacterium]|nr:serine/threonine-protein kinase [Vicinamibacterales bacterium]
MLSVGQLLDGRYEILAPLAEGGMGAVYLARRVLLGDDVAIKVILADQEGPAPLERFVRESRACAQLRHPNIVSILDYNADDPQRPFLVMELLSGPSLKDELAEKRRFPVAELQRIIPPVCSALALAHARGIIHRDLKPANIVAHDFGDGRVHKVVDFGVATVRHQGDERRLTGSQQFIGTVAYASPEQLTGGAVDARSDVYSMGVVIFELATGRLPFEGGDAMAVVAAHLNRPAPLPSSVCPGLPPWLDVAVSRALAKDPEDRWPDMAALGRAMAGPAAVGVTESSGRLPIGAAGGLLGTYEIGEVLGPGRLGSTVHRGVHRALGHPVAIRILRGVTDRDDAARERFLHEARAMQVAHPSILHVRDYGEEGNLVYVVTDFIEGPSMRQLLTEGGPLPWPRLSRFAGQLLEAAHVLHRRKGLLCGLSPDIIRVATDEDGERIMISSAGIWDAQDLLGTLQEQTLRGMGLADAELRYVAPELFTGRNADVRSDVFTLGVLLYEMATGATPFDGATLPELLGKMLTGTARDPRELQPTLPERAAAAIQTALNTAPEKRHAGAREFAAAFGGESP